MNTEFEERNGDVHTPPLLFSRFLGYPVSNN